MLLYQVALQRSTGEPGTIQSSGTCSSAQCWDGHHKGETKLAGGPLPWPQPAPSQPLGKAAIHGVIYLELVELEQVTVTATSEGGEEPALLWPPLRASPGGSMRLGRDAHTLWGQMGDQNWPNRPNTLQPPCKQSLVLQHITTERVAS